MRVTQSMLTRTVVGQVSRATERIRRLHEMIATGRRVLRPSDDPAAARSILFDRARLGAIETHNRSMDRARATLSVMETALGSADELVARARVITLEGLNGTTEPEARQALADEVRSLRASLLIAANSSVEGRYLFGGGESTVPPYEEINGKVVYRGNDFGRSIAADDLERVGVTVSGRDVLAVHPAEIQSAVDLNPAVVALTPLHDLHAGMGAAMGSIQITDSNGTVATVDLSGAFSVGDVLALINAAPLSITAAIRTDQTGIEVRDLGSGTTITIEDVGGGAAANRLGILGSAAGTIAGTDLDPKLAYWNPLAILNGGAGITPGSILVDNSTGDDVRTGSIDLSGAGTIAQLIHTVEHAGLEGGRSFGLDMELSADGRSLDVVSTLPTTTLDLRDAPGGSLLSGLGLADRAQAQDLFNLFDQLAEELAEGVGDPDGVLTDLLGRLDTSLDRVLRARADLGVRMQHLDRIGARLDREEVEVGTMLDATEGTDLPAAITDLSLLETQYQATLASGSRLIRQSLLDYLR